MLQGLILIDGWLFEIERKGNNSSISPLSYFSIQCEEIALKRLFYCFVKPDLQNSFFPGPECEVPFNNFSSAESQMSVFARFSVWIPNTRINEVRIN